MKRAFILSAHRLKPFRPISILVAHKIFGVPATINCANYVYFLALAELSKIPNPKMLTIFTGKRRLQSKYFL